MLHSQGQQWVYKEQGKLLFKYCRQLRVNSRIISFNTTNLRPYLLLLVRLCIRFLCLRLIWMWGRLVLICLLTLLLHHVLHPLHLLPTTCCNTSLGHRQGLQQGMSLLLPLIPAACLSAPHEFTGVFFYGLPTLMWMKIKVKTIHKQWFSHMNLFFNYDSMTLIFWHNK